VKFKAFYEIKLSFDWLANHNEKIIQHSRTLQGKSKCHGTQAHAPILIEIFPKTPRTQFEASRFSGFYNYKTKQTTFLHR
jgi:hypothetical protein